MRIVFLSRWFPFPPNNGSKLRIYNLLRGLSPHHEISFISFYDPAEGIPDPHPLLKYCRKVRFLPVKPFQPNSMRSLVGYFSRKPRSVIDTYSSMMGNLIADEISQNTYHLVIASQFDMAIYAQHLHSLPAIFEEAEVGLLYEQYSHSRSLPQRFRYGMTWRKHCNYLNSLLRYFKACTVVSKNEYQLMKMAAPGFKNIEVIPNFLNLDDYHGGESSQPYQIVFTGSFSYYPNFEAMDWFISEVFPKILTRIPEAHLTITGDSCEQSLPNNHHVTHVGFVEDIRPYVTRASCCVVPLLTGGGTRLKILEAWALGTPVISTSKGAEGLNANHGVHLLIADDPESFANSVIQILEDQILRKKIIDNAYRLVNNEYSSKVIIPHYLDLIQKTTSNVL